MDEQELQDRFVKFLIDEKNYPRNSLLTKARAFAVQGRRAEADLLLMDVRIGDYIGIVEFKGRIEPDVKRHAKRQTQEYLSIVKAPGLPTYLVYPLSEDDFQILVLGDSEWLSITKDEFPQFETLSAKKKIEEKVAEKDLQERLVVEREFKVERTRTFSLLTLGSLVVGVLTTVLVFYKTLYIGEIEKRGVNIQQYKINALQDSLNKKWQQFTERASLVDTLYIIDSSSTVQAVEKRLTIIEKGIVDSPEKVLAISNINADLRVLREEVHGQEKLLSARYENLLTRIEWLNALVLGVVVSLFAASIGFVITSFNDKRKSNKVI